MQQEKPDHQRVLEFLKNRPLEYLPTYDIASKCNMMHNSVHRALDTLEHKMGVAVDHKPFTTTGGKRVMSYKLGKAPDPRITEYTAILNEYKDKQPGHVEIPKIEKQIRRLQENG